MEKLQSKNRIPDIIILASTATLRTFENDEIPNAIDLAKKSDYKKK